MWYFFVVEIRNVELFKYFNKWLVLSVQKSILISWIYRKPNVCLSTKRENDCEIEKQKKSRKK